MPVLPKHHLAVSGAGWWDIHISHEHFLTVAAQLQVLNWPGILDFFEI